MIEKIKLLLGLTDHDKDELLETLIEMAVADAVAISGVEDIEAKLPTAIIKMVVYTYNRLGTEGVKSESYSGTQYTYETNNYPQEIISMLKNASNKRGKVYFIK